MARKRKSKPTSKSRSSKQRARDRLAHALDDARTAGAIEMRPEEVLGNERVDPASQGSQQLPGLVLQALKEDWSTPDVAKPKIVAALLEPFYQDDVVLDKDGNQVKVPPNRGMLIACTKALKELDQTQWERDHPRLAGQAKGGDVNVGVQVNTGDEIRQLMAAVEKQKQVGKEQEHVGDRTERAAGLRQDDHGGDAGQALPEPGPQGGLVPAKSSL